MAFCILNIELEYAEHVSTSTHAEGGRYLRIPRDVEATRFRAVRCKAGSSDHKAA